MAEKRRRLFVESVRGDEHIQTDQNKKLFLDRFAIHACRVLKISE
jgi:hypothetical protein